MTIEDAPATSRRALREQSGDTASDAVPAPHGRIALAWLDDDAVTAQIAAEPAQRARDLLARRPWRSPVRAGVVVPILSVAAVAGAYAAATLLWPLYAVLPEVDETAVPEVTADASDVAWPDDGSAAVAVEGFDTVPASTTKTAPIASITKLVTVLMALEEMPLELGEDGDEFAFTYSDRQTYYNYLYSDESALDVPVGGTLTEYELLQGILIGSAGNYADRLASTFWPTDAVFAAAAEEWLDRHGLAEVTVVGPTGISAKNKADPASVIALAEIALDNPVIAEIVATKSVTLPGAGKIENTNELLKDDGVVGVKTGSLSGQYNLVAAKDIAVGEQTVRVYAVTLTQPTEDARADETARLLDEVSDEVAPVTLAAETRVGTVTTPWGATADIVTDADASVILWDGATATTATTLSLGDARTADQAVGSLTITGPLDAQTVGAHLTADIPDPDAWWRLTHPLELFGLVD
ncbi:MAG: D-alanyl-D-alanine carboxypeptidase [Microbacterium sp.]